MCVDTRCNDCTSYDITPDSGAGAHVFTVAALRYSKRAVLRAEHEAHYNWATDELPRPLYQFVMMGDPLPYVNIE